MKKILIKRKYPQCLVDNIEKEKQINIYTLRETKRKKVIPYISTFNPTNTEIYTCIQTKSTSPIKGQTNEKPITKISNQKK